MKQQSENTRKLRLVANNVRDTWPDHEDDEITLTAIPSAMPAPARAGLGFLLAVPPAHRAALIALALVSVAVLVGLAVWTGSLPSWLL